MQQTTAETFSVDSLWINLGSTVVTVAVVLGIFVYILGFWSGGRRNKAKINVCILFTTLINFFAMPFALKIYRLFSDWLTPTIGFIVTLTLWIAFMAGVALHMYEIFVVTAKEAQAHPE